MQENGVVQRNGSVLFCLSESDTIRKQIGYVALHPIDGLLVPEARQLGFDNFQTYRRDLPINRVLSRNFADLFLLCRWLTQRVDLRTFPVASPIYVRVRKRGVKVFHDHGATISLVDSEAPGITELNANRGFGAAGILAHDLGQLQFREILANDPVSLTI